MRGLAVAGLAGCGP